MANARHVELVRMWAAEVGESRRSFWTYLDLSGADLRGVDLSRLELRRANLSGADLRGAKLRDVGLCDADLTGADLRGADLARAALRRAEVALANLSDASLVETDLGAANLSGANLAFANLTLANLAFPKVYDCNDYVELPSEHPPGANLTAANLSHANLSHTDFENSKAHHTAFVGVDLSTARGLAFVDFQGPCSIGVDTLRLTRGLIPPSFLRGCGLAEWEVQSAYLHDPDLAQHDVQAIQQRVEAARVAQPIQSRPVFVSAADWADTADGGRIRTALESSGVRAWSNTHLHGWGPINEQLRKADRDCIAVVLLSGDSRLSEAIIAVVGSALGAEAELRRRVFCPIALDSAWKDSPLHAAFSGSRGEQDILDFSGRADDGRFEAAMRQLIERLRRWYGPRPGPDEEVRSG